MTRTLPWLPALVIGAVLATVLGAAWVARLPYPYDLEWMEGGMLAHAWRLQRGLPLYAEPSALWVPFIYPPGYPALLALGGDQLSAPLGRAISLIGTALSLASITWIVARWSAGPHRVTAGLLAALVFAGTWADSGTFMDLVRPDALALGLTLAATACALERRWVGPIIGGLLLAAAFACKHPMAAFGPAIALGLWARDGRIGGALRFTLAAAVPAAIFTAALHLQTGGTFLRYLIDVPRSHVVVVPRLFPGTPWELGSALPFAVPGLATYLAWRAHRALGRRAVWAVLLLIGVALALILSPRDGGTVLGPIDRLVHLLPALPLGSAVRLVISSPLAAGAGLAAFAVGGVALALLALTTRTPNAWRTAALPVLLGATVVILSAILRSHHGGYLNVYLPLHAFVAIGVGLAAARAAATAPRAGLWIAAALIAAQLGWSLARLDAERFVPTERDRLVGDAVVARLAQLDGPVWSPVAPWLAVQAGKDPGPHLIAIWDVALHPAGPWPDSADRIERGVRDGAWSYVLAGRKTTGFGVEATSEHGRRLALPSRTFYPRAGWRTRPEVLHELRAPR